MLQLYLRALTPPLRGLAKVFGATSLFDRISAIERSYLIKKL
jgi:hypothetical protein